MNSTQRDEDGQDAAKAVEALYRRFRPALLAFFLRRQPSYAEAEDMAQEVLARVVARPDREMTNPEGYLFEMAANILRDRARRHAVRASYRERMEAVPEAAVDPVTAERVLMARESVTRIAQLLETLPERTRSIFILYRLESMSRQQVAEAYGISVSAVDKHIARAMALILHEMEGES